MLMIEYTKNKREQEKELEKKKKKQPTNNFRVFKHLPLKYKTQIAIQGVYLKDGNWREICFCFSSCWCPIHVLTDRLHTNHSPHKKVSSCSLRISSSTPSLKRVLFGVAVLAPFPPPSLITWSPSVCMIQHNTELKLFYLPQIASLSSKPSPQSSSPSQVHCLEMHLLAEQAN